VVGGEEVSVEGAEVWPERRLSRGGPLELWRRLGSFLRCSRMLSAQPRIILVVRGPPGVANEGANWPLR